MTIQDKESLVESLEDGLYKAYKENLEVYGNPFRLVSDTILIDMYQMLIRNDEKFLITWQESTYGYVYLLIDRIRLME